MIEDLIVYFNIENFVRIIDMNKNDNIHFYSYYNKSNGKLYFNNKILESPSYNAKFNKAVIYILHEIIHILQIKRVSGENQNIAEIEILKNSLNNNDSNYKAIMPLHEYQAFLNSNLIMLKYLVNFRKCDCDIEIIKQIIIAILYNNYYSSNMVFTSPIYETAKKLGIEQIYNQCNKHYEDDKVLSRILFGSSIKQEEFNIEVKTLNKVL